MSTVELITIDPEIMGGVPVFAGTRVPIQALVDYLSEGDTVDTFVEDFPTVTREQAMAVMKAKQSRLSPTGR